MSAAAIALTTFSAPALAQDQLSPQVQRVMAYIADHGVSVVPTGDGGAFVVLETEFVTHGTPELHIILGKDGVLMPEADLGTLQKITGLQVFRTPATLDIDGFNEVHVWDSQNKIVVGVAPLG